ncbi:hypothetical protein M422DRAFT_31939 [Sphaerobolus stellatus SS14]|uniref:Uncharacterized protein n=1 Tax=Sphaerobolus stellatus (strain SS14) TaxID=990650 RepID=A0A0C9T8M7_SPHS4|nr:hypothetical protein M422DRAFT_38808 [Sphaerobolus stellatus SS14]KIJ41055.1 hypothetical protein M422DRAFT_31939 [Sphaerobolus stellatus SS14]
MDGVEAARRKTYQKESCWYKYYVSQSISSKFRILQNTPTLTTASLKLPPSVHGLPFQA